MAYSEHSLTPRQKDKILAEQVGRCGICLRTDRVLQIDHDHGTCHPGQAGCPMCVRGMLCAQCNTMLGQYEAGRIGERGRSGVDFIAEYLSCPPASRALAGYRSYVQTFRDS